MIQRPAGLADIVAPMSEDDFLKRIWGARMMRFRGKRGRFESLLAWSELNRLVTEHRLGPPRVRLYRNGVERPIDGLLRRWPSAGAGRTSFDVPLLGRELRAGTMLVVDAADEASPEIRRLAETLERKLGEHVLANAYAGWGKTRGFSPHCDAHDVLVLQISGRKSWRVFPAARPYPLTADVRPNAAPPRRPLWRGVLNSGDALYIPRGWWHDAAPVGEPTLHVTFTITKRTGIDLTEYMVERLKDSPLFRMDLPRFRSAAEQAEHLQRWREGIRDAASRMDLRDYFADHDSRALPREQLSLPFAATSNVPLQPGDVVRWLPPRNVVFGATANGDVSFRALGRDWVFGSRAFRILDALSRKRSARVSALRRADRRFSGRGLDSLLFELVCAGLIAVERR
jgi:ribosomal protein L16 Arg81 hydroxylase